MSEGRLPPLPDEVRDDLKSLVRCHVGPQAEIAPSPMLDAELAIRRALLAEREACANLVASQDLLSDLCPTDPDYGKRLAAKIRARPLEPT